MIDVNLPLELEDGTPVTLVKGKHSKINGIFQARTPKTSRKGDTYMGGGGTWWYNLKDGTFQGREGDPNYFRVRNVPLGPDAIEEMFS